MEEKKIRLERDALAGALSVVERIVQAKDKALDPRYEALLLEADASTSKLSIVARDAACVAIAKVGAEVVEDVRVAMPGRLLIDYVKALPAGGDVKLTTASGPSGETSTLEVDSGTHKCAIPVLPSGEDYDIPAMDDGDTSRSTVPGGVVPRGRAGRRIGGALRHSRDPLCRASTSWRASRSSGWRAASRPRRCSPTWT